MLRFLTIRHLAVIDAVDVDFDAGLNVLTGETGAGKSILVEAIGLAILALPHFVVETITNPEPTEASMDHTVNNMQTIKKLGDDVADKGLSKDQVLYNLTTQKLIGHQEENGDK